MDRKQALALAAELGDDGRAELISVGRFLPLGELSPASPWGCSVLVPGAAKARVVWSRDEWLALFCPEPAAELSGDSGAFSAAPAPKPIPKPVLPPRPDAAHRRQPTLF
jgi:hypothetical protein